MVLRFKKKPQPNQVIKQTHFERQTIRTFSLSLFAKFSATQNAFLSSTLEKKTASHLSLVFRVRANIIDATPSLPLHRLDIQPTTREQDSGGFIRTRWAKSTRSQKAKPSGRSVNSFSPPRNIASSRRWVESLFFALIRFFCAFVPSYTTTTTHNSLTHLYCCVWLCIISVVVWKLRRAYLPSALSFFLSLSLF